VLEALEDRLQPSTLPTVSGITLRLPGLANEPAAGLAVTSVHGGDIYSVGAQARYEPFALTMPVSSSTPALELAAVEGKDFTHALITVFTGNHHRYVTFHLNHVIVSSFQLGGHGDVPTVAIDLVFSGLATSGRGAADSLPVPVPHQPISGITLTVQPPHSAASAIDLDSLTAEETFTVGQQPRYNFQATTKLDRNAQLLLQAEINGTIFHHAQVALYTGHQKAAATFQLTDMVITSVKVSGGNAVPELAFDFIAADFMES
jgi:type VI protein secretion system component Hcp